MPKMTLIYKHQGLNVFKSDNQDNISLTYRQLASFELRFLQTSLGYDGVIGPALLLKRVS